MSAYRSYPCSCTAILTALPFGTLHEYERPAARSSACEFHESAWPALRSGEGVIDQRSQLQPYRGLTERVAVFDQGGDSFPVLRIFEVHDVIAHMRISFRLLVAVQVVRLAASRK